MATISASLVKTLRERTNVGMMDCKKALVQAEGDLEKAVQILRETGKAKTDKKSDRTASEGLIAVYQEGDKAAQVEINSETDFVARADDFKAFAEAVAKTAVRDQITDVDALNAATLAGAESTVQDTREQLVGKLGENIVIRRIALFQAEAGQNIGGYAHGAGNLARIAVVVVLQGGDAELAKDIAMHTAAMRPEYITKDEMPQERLEQEKAIILARVSEENPDKPDDIKEKIMMGRLNKIFSECTLLGQPFVKDGDKTVEKLLKEKKAEIKQVVRFEVGEGIEKKEDNFAEEVMAQVRGD